MTKSRRHIYKKPKNKTLKVTFSKKKQFIQAILKEWSKKGHYEKDKLSIYKDDYYLSFHNNNDFYNHVHLILKHFSKNHNNNNIKYIMKKMDNQGNITHSKEIKISIFSDPKEVVRDIIQNYKEFNAS